MYTVAQLFLLPTLLLIAALLITVAHNPLLSPFAQRDVTMRRPAWPTA
jgi:hypothetical protein